MAAARRGRKAAYQKRAKWQRRTWAPKIRSRRKKLQSKQRKKTKTRRAVRFAKSRYRPRRNTTTRHFDRRLRKRAPSCRKNRCPVRSYRRKANSRKPRRLGRPRKDKRRSAARSRCLHTTIRRKSRKRQATCPETAAPQKGRRRSRKNEDGVFYGMANTSSQDGTADEKQSKKHSVHFANPANSRSKDLDLHLQDDSVDNQSGQQLGSSKKRGRHSTTPVQKSR